MSLDDTEGHCRLCSGAGFGDDHCGHRFILNVVEELGVIFLREVEAGEHYVNAFLIEVERVRESLKGRLGSEIGAADADDHGHLYALVLPFPCNVLAALDDGLRSIHRQIKPAKEIIASPLSSLKGIECVHGLFDVGLRRFEIYIYHNYYVLSS